DRFAGRGLRRRGSVFRPVFRRGRFLSSPPVSHGARQRERKRQRHTQEAVSLVHKDFLSINEFGKFVDAMKNDAKITVTAFNFHQIAAIVAQPAEHHKTAMNLYAWS